MYKKSYTFLYESLSYLLFKNIYKCPLSLAFSLSVAVYLYGLCTNLTFCLLTKVFSAALPPSVIAHAPTAYSLPRLFYTHTHTPLFPSSLPLLFKLASTCAICLNLQEHLDVIHLS